MRSNMRGSVGPSFGRSAGPSVRPAFVKIGKIKVFRCVRISIRGLVRRSVRPSVGWSVMLLSNWVKNGPLRILNDLDSAGRGGRRDEEEGGTRRKEGGGGRRDEEEGETRRKEEREE